MNWKQWIEKKEGKTDWFGKLFPILLGLGVIFLIVSNTHISKQKADESALVAESTGAAGNIDAVQLQTDTYEEQLARRLEEMLTHIEGAGRVQVMLTLDDGGEAYVLQDSEYARSEAEESAASGESRKTLQVQNQTETVRDAQDQPYVLKEITPRVRGVLILAEGAGSSVVQQELLMATQALLGVSASNVHIAPYQ